MALARHKSLSLVGSIVFHSCLAGVFIIWSASHPIRKKFKEITPAKSLKVTLSQVITPAKPLLACHKIMQNKKISFCSSSVSAQAKPQIVTPPITVISNAVETVLQPMVSEKKTILASPLMLASVLPSSTQAAAKVNESISTEPEFNADYLENPTPIYPKISMRMREEGRVVLHVLVSKDGLPVHINIKSSCGFERLDSAAQEVIKKWKFVPAKKGNEAIEGWVNIPINFRL